MKNKNNLNKGKVLIYKTSKNEVELRVVVKEETIWLNAKQTGELFGVNRPAIVKHIGNIYKTNELKEDSTCSKMEQIAKDGKKRKMNFYNLDIKIYCQQNFKPLLSLTNT